MCRYMTKKVTIGDLAQILCTDKQTENLVKTIKVPQATNGKPGRHTMSVMELIERIQEEVSGLEINNIGEYDFLVTYEAKKSARACAQLRKKPYLSRHCRFLGAAFTIMTFNNDVDIPKLFAQIYQQFTGTPSSGFTVMEFSYSIGLGLGILLFFNHFGGRKITADPTPLEVEMRTYEDEIDTTLIERSTRDPKKQKNTNQQKKAGG